MNVLFFAVYRDLAGASELALELPPGSTVASLIEAVSHRLGADCTPGHLVVAVNQEYASAGQVLKEGDEVALIPPVAGG